MEWKNAVLSRLRNLLASTVLYIYLGEEVVPEVLEQGHVEGAAAVLRLRHVVELEDAAARRATPPRTPGTRAATAGSSSARTPPATGPSRRR
jgi:hypothetical protein